MFLFLPMLLAMLFVLVFLLGIGFRLTGALICAVFWSLIEVPLGLAAMLLGIVLCFTIILLPLGIGCMKTGVKLLVPGL